MNIKQAINIAKGCVMASYMDSETKQTVIEALNLVAISKTEKAGCEWCEISSACEYEVTFFRDDDRWATERSLMPKFCPNCGKSVKEIGHV